ncbi:unnamed protein product, partial [Prorocentrum cordatum]
SDPFLTVLQGPGSGRDRTRRKAFRTNLGPRMVPALPIACLGRQGPGPPGPARSARALAGGGLRGVRPAARLPAPALRGCVRRGRARQLPRRGRAPADPDQRRPHARGVAGRVPRHEPAG